MGKRGAGEEEIVVENKASSGSIDPKRTGIEADIQMNGTERQAPMRVSKAFLKSSGASRRAMAVINRALWQYQANSNCLSQNRRARGQ